jgi:hypothetical protein
MLTLFGFSAYSKQFSATLSHTILFGVVILLLRLWMVSPNFTGVVFARLILISLS